MPLSSASPSSPAAYVLTDTIFAAFNEIFSESLKGTAVVITARNPVEQEGGEIPTIGASLLAACSSTPGVQAGGGGDLHPGRLLQRRSRSGGIQVRAEVHLLDAARRA